MKIENIKKEYDGKVVLDIEALEFEKGRIYAIVGANGSGKSTLLRILAGTLKSDKTEQKSVIDFEGQSHCFMPQKNYAFKMRMDKNVMLSVKKTDENKASAEALMRELKIDHLKAEKAHKLSGGETARMALCRTVLSGADVLLLDEPTAAMDIESTMIAEDIICRYRDKNDAIIIMVTHSINQARRLSDSVIFMKDGAVLEQGPKDDVLNHPKQAETKEFLEFFSSEI